MNNDTSASAAQPLPRTASAVERLMFRDVGGVPVALIACALAAVVFGSLVAMSSGMH